MSRRVELGNKLKTVLGNNNTFFQPSNNTKLKYPCCTYALDGVSHRHANDYVYRLNRRYVVTFITTDPDNDYIDQMFNMFTKCRFDRRYVADNLYHNVFTVYY